METGELIHVLYCEACQSMGFKGVVHVDVVNRKCEISVPDICRELHPSLAPPVWQYQLLQSADDGKTWKCAWRGWPKGAPEGPVERIDLMGNFFETYYLKWLEEHHPEELANEKSHAKNAGTAPQGGLGSGGR